MGKAIPTVEGWHSQHMVFAMDFSAWNCFTAEEKAEAAKAGKDGKDGKASSAKAGEKSLPKTSAVK